jgi:hypothetical protein
VKDRLLTLALAIAAFAAFYAFVIPKQRAVDKPTRPLSTEAGPNGYLALRRWLDSQGVPTVQLRQRYDKLEQLNSATASRSLLISTLPHLLPMRGSEAPALNAWVHEGNTLLVVAGLADTPEWSMGEGLDRAIVTHLESITGMRFVQVSNVAPPANHATGSATTTGSTDQRQPKAESGRRRKKQPLLPASTRFEVPQRHELIPNGPHPLLDGVRSVAALSEYPSEQFFAEPTFVNAVLELGHDRAASQPVLWLARYGQGQILVCGYGSVLTNKLLAQADNARLLANIVALSLRGAGRVIIDDAHQGAVEFYDADAFYGDPRLHRTLLWLMALWLCFVLGPQRLRAAGAAWGPVDITAFVRATGGFLARVVKPAAAAQQLFDNFFDEIRHHTGQPAQSAFDWDTLYAQGGDARADIAQLRDLHARTTTGKRVDLVQLQNLLVRVRHELI